MRDNAGLWRRTDWSGYETVVAGGMWLLRGGAWALDPRGQGFRDPSLFRPNPRVAVGLTATNKLLLVATGQRVTLGQWARTLRALGARDALNLDGGSSTALFFNGKPVIQPGRALTNVLVVHALPVPFPAGGGLPVAEIAPRNGLRPSHP
jgi:exopolysaccharide biosynthesis protein